MSNNIKKKSIQVIKRLKRVRVLVFKFVKKNLKVLIIALVVLPLTIWFFITGYNQLSDYNQAHQEVKQSSSDLVLGYTRLFRIAMRRDEEKYQEFFDLDCEKEFVECVELGRKLNEGIFDDENEGTDLDIYNVLRNLDLNTSRDLDLYENNLENERVLKVKFPIIIISPFL